MRVIRHILDFDQFIGKIVHALDTSEKIVLEATSANEYLLFPIEQIFLKKELKRHFRHDFFSHDYSRIVNLILEYDEPDINLATSIRY